MIYRNDDYSKLPTISQLLQLIRELKEKVSVRHLMPYDKPVEGDVFILSKTSTGLFTLKPNITRQPFLYFGQPGDGANLKTSWGMLKSAERYIWQLKRLEFQHVMWTHPLYKLLFNGLMEEGFRLVNPFGNNLAYGFPMPYVPLTSSLETAAFFATHKQKDNGRFEYIEEKDTDGNDNIGVLFLLELGLKFPMIQGLSTVGKQAFKRPGNLKLFAISMNDNEVFDDNPFVRGFTFRQDADESKKIGEMLNGGANLYPDELIAKKADKIKKANYVSELTLNLFLQTKKEEERHFIRYNLDASHFDIIKGHPCFFTEDELDKEYYSHSEEIWDDLFSNVIALHPGFDNILLKLKDVPKKEKYKDYFRR